MALTLTLTLALLGIYKVKVVGTPKVEVEKIRTTWGEEVVSVDGSGLDPLIPRSLRDRVLLEVNTGTFVHISNTNPNWRRTRGCSCPSWVASLQRER